MDVAGLLRSHDLRGDQLAAAETALGQVAQQRGSVDANDVSDWLNALWPDSGLGVMDPNIAAKTLDAFCDRKPLAGPGLGAIVLSGGHAAANARLAARDDGKDWRTSIDTRDIDARVEAFKADLAWVLSKDISDPAQYEEVGRWIGWRPANENFYDLGTSWTNPLVTDRIISALSSRHMVPEHVSRSYLVDAFSDDPAVRARQAKAFGALAEPYARKGLAREAAFVALFKNVEQIQERTRYGGTDLGEVLAEFEAACDLAPGTIPPSTFREALPGMRGDDLAYAKRYPSTSILYRGYVADEASQHRIADVLQTSGTFQQLTSKAIDEEAALAAVAEQLGIEPHTINWQVFQNGLHLAHALRNHER